MIGNQVNLKQQKLAKERTAFSKCRADMSDVNFEIGKSSYTAKLFGFIVIFAIFFGVRIISRRYVRNPDMTFSIGDIVFWCCIGIIAILVIVTFIREKISPLYLFRVKLYSTTETVGQAMRFHVSSVQSGLSELRFIQTAKKY